jgi:FkbM family methyltransferase
VFDPCVSETMYRLIDRGDVVVDVGANIGYLTSLAAARSGGTGKVIGFEPHPGVFALLEANAARWAVISDIAPVELHEAALSDHGGSGELATGARFDANMGLAALHSPSDAAPDGELHTVVLKRLDDCVPTGLIGLLKIDVEGHEAEVLRGARALIESGRVRDVVFEDHGDYPSEPSNLLEASGYRLFSLANDLFGLKLSAPEDRGPAAAWPGPSYLATREPGRAVARLGPRGWRIKGIGPRRPWGTLRSRRQSR